MRKAVLSEEPPKKTVPLEKYEGAERDVLSLLTQSDMTPDEMLVNLNISAPELNTALITLEMEGIISKKIDKRYSII